MQYNTLVKFSRQKYDRGPGFLLYHHLLEGCGDFLSSVRRLTIYILQSLMVARKKQLNAILDLVLESVLWGNLW
jgi:hypothetical protein